MILCLCLCYYVTVWVKTMLPWCLNCEPYVSRNYRSEKDLCCNNRNKKQNKNKKNQKKIYSSLLLFIAIMPTLCCCCYTFWFLLSFYQFSLFLLQKIHSCYEPNISYAMQTKNGSLKLFFSKFAFEINVGRKFDWRNIPQPAHVLNSMLSKLFSGDFQNVNSMNHSQRQLDMCFYFFAL